MPVLIDDGEEAAPAKPRLLLIAAGINDCRAPGAWLAFAKPDAQAFAQEIREHLPPQYDAVSSLAAGRKLYDSTATRPALMETLDGHDGRHGVFAAGPVHAVPGRTAAIWGRPLHRRLRGQFAEEGAGWSGKNRIGTVGTRVRPAYRRIAGSISANVVKRRDAFLDAAYNITPGTRTRLQEGAAELASARKTDNKRKQQQPVSNDPATQTIAPVTTAYQCSERVVQAPAQFQNAKLEAS